VIVVSDSSPLIALAAIGQLHLLRALFGEVLVPEVVWGEISHQSGKPGVHALLEASWIRRVEVAQDSYLMALQTEIDDGEAEALALAAEVNADMVLLDERRGRKMALEMGFRVIGTAGVLGLAWEKRRGSSRRSGLSWTGWQGSSDFAWVGGSTRTYCVPRVSCEIGQRNERRYGH
jgi:predicted nucleic acid-binding protein